MKEAPPRIPKNRDFRTVAEIYREQISELRMKILAGEARFLGKSFVFRIWGKGGISDHYIDIDLSRPNAIILRRRRSLRPVKRYYPPSPKQPGI